MKTITTMPRRTGFFKANHQFWVFFLGGRGGDHCVSEFFLLFSSNGSHIFCQNIVKSEFRSAFFFSQIHFRNIYFQNFSACQQTQKSCGRLKCVHSVDIGVGLTRRRGNEVWKVFVLQQFQRFGVRTQIVKHLWSIGKNSKKRILGFYAFAKIQCPVFSQTKRYFSRISTHSKFLSTWPPPSYLCGIHSNRAQTTHFFTRTSSIWAAAECS